jgi:hypothetical protein
MVVPVAQEQSLMLVMAQAVAQAVEEGQVVRLQQVD